jgi:hypothetical protein
MLEIVLAQQAAGFAAIHIGQANVKNDEVDVPSFYGRETLSGGMRNLRVELLMQGKLLGQGPSKVLIIVDNQYIARIAHDCLR